MENNLDNMINTALNNIRELLDVNTIVGRPIQINPKISIVPISKVNAGFVSGGGELSAKKQKKIASLPFAGGSGTGISILPVGILVVKPNSVQYISTETKIPYSDIVDIFKQYGEKVFGDKILGEKENEKK